MAPDMFSGLDKIAYGCVTVVILVSIGLGVLIGKCL